MIDVKKIAQNTAIQVFGKALTIAVALVGFGLITRYLGTAGYGNFATVYAFLTIFGILIDLGLQMTTTQLISDPANDEARILSNALTIRLAASLVFLALAPAIVLFFPYPPAVKAGVALAALGFVFSSLTATLTSHFQKHLIMGKAVTADVAAKVIYLAAITLAIISNWGLLGIIGATAIDSAAVFFILIYFARQRLLLKPRYEPEIWKLILGKTWPIALTIALNLIYFKGDILIMSFYQSETAVGLYGAPYKILEVLINIAYLFLGLILPLLAATAAARDFGRMKIVIQTTFNFLIIMTLPMIVGGYFLGRQLMVMMAGPDFAVSGEIIKILLIATGAIYISGLFGYAVVALDKQKEMIKFYALNAAVSIIGYLYFIPRYSYWGAAAMTVFTESFILLTAAYTLYRAIKFVPGLKILWKSAGACVVMAAVLSSLQGLYFPFAVCLGALVYFVALFLLRGFDKQMVMEVIK